MNNLLFQLKDIQSHLESEYLGLGENFKNLVDEMEISLSRGKAIVADFKLQISSEGRESLSGRMEGIRILVEKENMNHKSLVFESHVFMDRLMDIYQRLASLQNPIASIQDSADLMSLLAINSMVVAIKAGDTGGGFTTITNELKTASSATHSYASEIERMGQRVHSGFGRFESLVLDIDGKEKAVGSFLSEELPKAFENFQKAISVFINQLEQLGSIAAGLQPRLMQIMQSLQNQDIIRQSMDHVILSLLELDVEEFKDEAGAAGYLFLKRQLYSLGRSVLEDVLRWLETDLDNMKAGASGCEDTLRQINQEKNKIYSIKVDKPSLFRDIEEELFSFKKKINSILSNTSENLYARKELFQENSILLSALNELKPHIQGLSELVDLFRNINVMARIEIARTDVFRTIEESVRQMATIVDRIEKAVSSIVQVEDYIQATSDENQTAFKLIIDQDKEFVETFRKDIRALITLTEDSMAILRTSLNGFNILSGSFLEIFSDTRGRIGTIEKCYREIQDLDRLFDKEIHILEEEVEKGGFDEVTGEEIRLRVGKILEKFTIFRHKKEAGNLTGLEISEETFLEESSIILF